MPHAPVLIPLVGRGRERDASATVDAMRMASQWVVEKKPDVLVVVSPHAERASQAFGICRQEEWLGDLGRFGLEEIKLRLPGHPELAYRLAKVAEEQKVKTWFVNSTEEDHGAFVPLWFLQEAGWSGPVLVVGLTMMDNWLEGAFGQAIRETIKRSGLKTVLIASGDMSHRLKPGAPAGFHQDASKFDLSVIDMLRGGNLDKVNSIDEVLRENAGEDVIASLRMASGVLQGASQGHRVLSYEGPFGVGYGVAILFEEQMNEGSVKQTGERLPGIARQSVTDALIGVQSEPPPPQNDFEKAANGVFVTLRTKAGRLRGCIGTLQPREKNTVAEVWRNARAAAFSDRRFEPLAKHELGDLEFEVSVLHGMESVASKADLDAKRYGVVVSTEDGRRGVLLPDLEGVESVEQQVMIASQKGMIVEEEPVTFQRFQVSKFLEQTNE